MLPLLIATSTLALVTLLARARGWGWTAPMIVYGVAWTAQVALYELRLFPFYDLSPFTWALIGLAAASFVTAAFVGGRLAGGRALTVTVATSDRLDARRLAWTMRAFFGIGLLGAAWFYWQVHTVLGLSALADSPMAVHNALSDRTIGSSHLFLYYLGVAAALLFGYLALFQRRHVRAVDVLLLVAFAVVMGASTERNHLLWTLVCWTFLLVAPPAGDARLGRILALGTAAVVFGVVFYVAAGGWLGKSAANLTNALILEARLADPYLDDATEKRLRTPGYLPDPDTDVPPESRLRWLLPGGAAHRLSPLYVSVAAALPTLDRGLAEHPRTYGQLTFRPFIRPLSRLGLVPDTLSGTFYDDVRTPYPANAYTYLYEHCRDFGPAGAIIFPAAFGLLAGWIYRRTQAKPGSYWTVWLAMLQAMILWSPFQNRFVLTVSAYLVAALLVAGAVARRRAAT